MTLSRPRLLFYVQHLLGIGHLVRGARIARVLAADSFDVTVTVGGLCPSGLDFGAATVVRLPPVRAGASGFSDLVTPDGEPFGPEARIARRDLLLARFEAVRPDVLLIEAFPFGRRQMRFELLPLLDAALARAAPPLIAASVRDILQEDRAPSREAETVDLVRRYFDLVVVHGDPRLTQLGDSFPRAGEFAHKLAYSGLVAPEPSGVETNEIFDVVVSVGGGAVGAALIDLALAAKPLCRLAGASWLVLTGPNLPEAAWPAARSGVTLRRFEPNLPNRLRQARLSVSQAGYNTVADLFSAPACRAVLIPHAAGGETEQTRRAGLMQTRGWALAVEEEGLTPAALASMIDAALDLPPRTTALNLDGAPRTGRILLDALARRVDQVPAC